MLHLTRHLVWLMGYTSDDRLYTAFPLFHNNAKYTSVCAALECGGSLVMDKRFPVSTFWEMAREKEITAFNYMGALLMMLHKQPPRPDDARQPDPDRVRRAVPGRDLGGRSSSASASISSRSTG